MALLLPQNWTTQPRFGVEVDPSSPFAQGLIFSLPMLPMQVVRDAGPFRRDSNAVTSSAVTWQTGQNGTELRFNGSQASGDVSWGDVDYFDGLSSATWEVDFITSSLTGGPKLIGKWGLTAAEQSVLISMNATGAVQLALYSNGAIRSWVTPSSTVAINTRYHLVVVWSGSTSATLFLNGRKLTFTTVPASATTIANSNTVLQLGRDTAGNALTGSIGMVNAWKRPLTDSEAFQRFYQRWGIFRPRTSPTLFVSAAGGAQTLLPDLYTNQQTFYSPTVTPGTVTLQPGLYTNTQTFYDPTVSVGPVTLLPDLFTNTNTIYPPTVLQAGLQTLLPDLFVNQNQFFPATIVGAGGGGMSKGWAAERRRLELSLEQRQATQTLAKSKNKVAKRVAKRIEQYVAAEIDAQAEIEQIARLQVEIAKLEALHDNRKQFNQEMREAAQILKDFVQDEQDAITLLMLVDDFDTRCVIEATAGPLNLASRMGSQ